jgi:hypothetical protein
LSGILQILESCGEFGADLGYHQRNRANPRPSYAKDEPRWGEKEFEQNNVRETVLEYPQKNVHFKTKVTQIRNDAGLVRFGHFECEDDSTLGVTVVN